MKHTLLFVYSFFLIFIFSTNLLSQTDSVKNPEYYKVSKVRIYINEKSDILELRKQDIGFDHIKIQDNYFDALLDSLKIDKLKKSGYLFEILIEDVTKDYLERTKESREKLKLKKTNKSIGFGYGSMGGFYTYDEVVAQLDTMRAQYPNLITIKDSIGTSIQGRTIWAVKISDNPQVDEDEPEIFYNALTHASEPEGIMVMFYFMYYLMENYSTNPEVKYLVNNREFYFVPVINPDGYVFNEMISPNGGGMWRKNRRVNGDGSFGVDLARNFSYEWGHDDIGSSKIAADIFYRGTGPFSEPESQAIRAFCINHNFIISMDFHAAWKVIFPPWGYNLEQTPDSTIFNSVIELAISFNNYRNGIYILPPENSPVNGYPDDWFYGETIEKNKIYSFLTEIGDYFDSWSPPEMILPLAEENLYSNLVFAWGPGIIENPPYVKNFQINKRYFNSVSDTLQINAYEYNPDEHESEIKALVYHEDSLINEIILNKGESYYNGEWQINSVNEDFYNLRLKQYGKNIPSNFYTKSVKFTTVGPLKLVLDSLIIESIAADKFILHNIGLVNNSAATTIKKAAANISTNDTIVTKYYYKTAQYGDLAPGKSKFISNPFAFQVSSNQDSIEFQIDISTNGEIYWSGKLTAYLPVVGIKENVAEIPIRFNLYQCYPNPFNPSTKIKYSIPSSVETHGDASVQLKVYDVLGREVAILVNEEKKPGEYEVEFNASNLPSGVYFYQLKAGEFIQTKKMVLLK